MKGRQKKSHEVAEFQRRVLKERRGEGGWYRRDPSRTVQSNPTFISPFVDRSLLRAVEGRKVYRYSEFQVAKKKKKSTGILGSYAPRAKPASHLTRVLSCRVSGIEEYISHFEDRFQKQR